MGITDGTKASSSAKSNTVIVSKAVGIAETNGCHESSIPQMVITSVEGESAELLLESDVLAPEEVLPVKDEGSEDKKDQPAVSAPHSPHEHDVLPHVDAEQSEASKPLSSVQTVNQRPLIIECSGESQTETVAVQNGELPETTKSTQTTVQRPLIIDSETAKKQMENVRPESIYEVIEPSERILDQENKVPVENENLKEEKDQPKAAKESDGFFAKSKAFWKQDAKPFFSFPKFSFGSKEPKESTKECKREEKVKAEEYSLEHAEASQESSHATELYRKLDDEAVLSKELVSTTKEQDTLQKKKPKTTDRAHMIHPVMAEPTKLLEKNKAEEDNFELREDQHSSPKTSGAGKRASTPESLYDTCCIKLAILLRNKAIEIASDGTKTSPPKKPPKPTAEALAKARSEIATKKLKEYESRPHNFGDNIPVGIDGIRYADEDTESSTDYKDVENFGIILNPECYGIIRKLKMENNMGGFSAPSTCSGMTSYYTADTATLKDENSSDNTLETVSLGSYDSSSEKREKHLNADQAGCKELPAINTLNLNDQKPVSLPNTLIKCSDQGSSKKVPPPVPPKPSILLKSCAPKTSSTPLKSGSKDMTRCVNSLSLSPRPILRCTSNAEGIKKRPLTIAGVKATEFEQYSQKKYTKPEKKPILNTVVRNNTLKNMRNLPAEPVGLTRSLSFSPQRSKSDTASTVPAAKPQPPPRPPPPIKTSGTVSASQQAEPNFEEEGSLPVEGIVPPPRKALLRHHISPPRPLPPASKPVVLPSVKTAVPPPRPPPPLSRISASDSTLANNAGTSTGMEQKDSVENSIVSNTDTTGLDENISALTNAEKLPQDSVAKVTDGDILNNEVDSSVDANAVVDTSDINLPSPSVDDVSYKVDVKETLSEKCESFVVTTDIICSPTDHDDGDVSHKKDVQPCQNTVIIAPARRLKQPKPPPRVRRKRSRTVEIVSLQDKVTDVRRRSQSLSDIEVEKRTVLDITVQEGTLPCNTLKPEDGELKALYTTVNKDLSKIKIDLRTSENDIDKLSSSSDVMSSRPLPPPPLPPRSKSHSASRRSKSDERPSNISSQCDQECHIIKSESMPSEINGGNLKPPTRKKKDSKQQFFSLRSRGREIDYSSNDKKFSSLKYIGKSDNLPVKPERRIKRQPIQFDENANIANPPAAPFSSTSSAFHLPSPETVPKVPSRPRVRSMGYECSPTKNVSDKGKSSVLQRSKSESKKSHSSWYDDEADGSKDINKVDSPLRDSWEQLDWPPEVLTVQDIENIKQIQTSPKGKKPRQTSTFYIDVEGNSPPCSAVPSYPPKEDKETSPLPLECSEKSVQTSLETLSVGVVSRSEMSEDTDELLGLAQTLQDELKTIIKRHKSGEALKSSDESYSTSEPSDLVHQSSSKKKSSICSSKPRPPLESTTSSASELWQISSSEESDDDFANQEVSNLSEISRTKKKKKIFYIAQEIMSSEEAFVDSLKLLNLDFRAFIDNVNKQKGTIIVPDDVLNQILNHLPQLQHLNENLLMELKYRIEQWDTVSKIADVIVKMGPFLKLYSWYIQDFESTTSVLEETKKKYPLFAQAVKEYEMSPRCKRLTLNHYMLKPVQRIPQYRLLLQEYLHQLPDGSEDYDDTVEALRIVSDVANHANESMRHGDNFQKLMSIQSSIIGHKEIIKPGRMFIKEGELMKLSRKGMQPRWFVLMNDLLLYLTPVQQGLYRINHELTLAGMKVAIPLQQDYQNEFSIISVTRSFTLNARSPEERQEWIVALTKAIEENASKRSTFTAGRLQQKSEHISEDVHDQGFVLGKTAPVWIPDSRVTMCQLCTSEFTVTFRRHHCRACGKVVCSICSSNRISLQYLGNRIARVCDECYTKLGQGSSACTESGETDSDNQQIAVKTHLRTDRHHKKPKRQLPSVLKEVCANDVGSTISGYMYKRSNNSWKKNWFVVKQKVLYEFKASEDVAALRSIPLLGFQINTFNEPFEGIDPSLIFEISHPGQAPILFHAETPGSAERWIKELKNATVLE